MSKVSKRARLEALERFVAARAEYLRATGWTPLKPAAPGAPVWWRHPCSDDEQREYREDQAAEKQELRDWLVRPKASREKLDDG
jgi:hypothetical protein